MFLEKPVFGTTIAPSTGLKIYVHNPLLLPDFATDGILVAPGFDHEMSIKQTNFKRIGKPYNNCISDLTSMNHMNTDTARKTLRHFKIYSYKNCLLTCLNDYVVKNTSYNVNLFKPEEQVPTIESQAYIKQATIHFYNDKESVSYCTYLASKTI